MYYLQSEVVQKVLLHYEDHWCKLKKVRAQNLPLWYTISKTLCCRIESIYREKLFSIRKIKNNCGLNLCFHNDKVYKEYVMVYGMKGLLQVNQYSTDK